MFTLFGLKYIKTVIDSSCLTLILNHSTHWPMTEYKHGICHDEILFSHNNEICLFVAMWMDRTGGSQVK